MIYVLLLEENKFYVGYSERAVGERFIEHFNYQGSKWTTCTLHLCNTVHTVDALKSKKRKAIANEYIYASGAYPTSNNV